MNNSRTSNDIVATACPTISQLYPTTGSPSELLRTPSKGHDIVQGIILHRACQRLARPHATGTGIGAHTSAHIGAHTAELILEIL